MRPLLIAAGVGWLASCQTPFAVPDQGDSAVFDRPGAHLDRQVTVCGQLEPGNLFRGDRTRSGDRIGISIVDRQNSAAGRAGLACVTGKVIRLGCGAETLCVDWQFEYGVIVDELRWLP